MDPEIAKKVGDDPRLYVIEAYLTKKGHGSSEVKYLKEKGLKYYLTLTGCNPEQGLDDSMVAKNK